MSRRTDQSVCLGARGLRFRGDKVGPQDLTTLQKFKGLKSLNLRLVHGLLHTV